MRPADLRAAVASEAFLRELGAAFAARGETAPEAAPVVVYVRHKPGVGTLLGLADGAEPQVAAAGLAAAPLGYVRLFVTGDSATSVRKHAGSADEPGWVAHLPGHDAAFFRFPRDRNVRGLASLVSAERLKHIVHATAAGLSPREERVRGSRSRVTLLRYKPERRCLVAADLATKDQRSGEKRTRRIVAQAYADDSGDVVRRVMDRIVRVDDADGRIGCPRPLGWDPGRRVLLQERVDGESLGLALDGPRALDATARAGSALRALAAIEPPAGLPVRDASTLRARARRVLDDLSALDGSEAGSVSDAATALARDLERASSAAPTGPPVLVHGDFHYHQVLVAPDRCRLIDWDEAGVGDARIDGANFLAHLVLREVEGTLTSARASALRAAFLAGWIDAAEPASELAHFVALHLALLATSPFRNLEPAWQTRSTAILDRARSLLAAGAEVLP